MEVFEDEASPVVALVPSVESSEPPVGFDGAALSVPAGSVLAAVTVVSTVGTVVEASDGTDEASDAVTEALEAVVAVDVEADAESEIKELSAAVEEPDSPATLAPSGELAHP